MDMMRFREFVVCGILSVIGGNFFTDRSRAIYGEVSGTSPGVHWRMYNECDFPECGVNDVDWLRSRWVGESPGEDLSMIVKDNESFGRFVYVLSEVFIFSRPFCSSQCIIICSKKIKIKLIVLKQILKKNLQINKI